MTLPLNLLQLYVVFFQIGLFSFGGGYAMFPLIEAEIIGRQWLTTPEFVDIVAVAEITPGTVSANTATFIGYRIAGLPGSFIATLGVITPSLILLLIFGQLLLRSKDNCHVKAVMQGLRPAFIALICLATVFIGETSFIDLPTILIGGGLFALAYFKKVSPFLIIGAGAVLGLIIYPFTL